MDQSQLIQLLSESAPQVSWLLGAGSSQSAGLPTALDVMWDLKRRYYCREENQKITANDVQNVAVQRKISAYMEAQGFPQPPALKLFLEATTSANVSIYKPPWLIAGYHFPSGIE